MMTKQDREWYHARTRRIRYQRAWFCCFLRDLLQGVRAKQPPPVVALVAKPTPLEPLTLTNAPSRRVLVPSSLWPGEPCKEHRRGGEERGQGWEAVVKSTSSRGRNAATGERVDIARVDFCFARDEEGRRYGSTSVELAMLRPLRTPPTPARGRPAHRFVLREPHPLASTYLIFCRSKWGVPALAGRPPPSLPAAADDVSAEKRRKGEAAFARYFVSNLVPWSAWNPPQLTFDRWCEHVEELETAACLHGEKDVLEKAGNALGHLQEPDADADAQPPPGFCEARRARLVAAARLTDIDHLMHGFKAPKLASVLLMKHRSRARTLWNAANPRPEGADGGDMTAGQREAVKELKKLRDKADRLRGTKSIATRLLSATAVQRWAAALRKELPASTARGPSATSSLHELWRCAARPARRTVDHRSRVREPTDVNAANRLPLSTSGAAGIHPRILTLNSTARELAADHSLVKRNASCE